MAEQRSRAGTRQELGAKAGPRLRDSWPLLRQAADLLREPRPLLPKLARLGLGAQGTSPRTRALRPRIHGPGVQKTVSVCPYCAVGCSVLVYHREGHLLDVEGNPASPINAGTLCPKGAASFGLTVNTQRLTTVLYRPPGGREWQERSLDWAMERIAQLVKETRDRGFRHQLDDGTVVNQVTNLASLGGATLDNEENYLIKKLFTGGLGVVWLENQARV